MIGVASGDGNCRAPFKRDPANAHQNSRRFLHVSMNAQAFARADMLEFFGLPEEQPLGGASEKRRDENFDGRYAGGQRTHQRAIRPV
jgi:hypothetical protein